MRRYVLDSKKLVNNVLSLTLSPQSKRDEIDYTPGQYISLGFRTLNGRPSAMRCFSIVSSPNDKNIELAIKVQGNFTQSLLELEPGNKLFIAGPYGDFVLNEHYDQNVIMLAAGIGITPFISFLRYARQMNLTNRFILLYSHPIIHMPFLDEILEHESKYPRLSSAFFVTQDTAKPPGVNRVINGRISEEYLKKLTKNDFNRATYFVCGPATFIDSMVTILKNNNTEDNRIVTEVFSASNKGLLPRDWVTRRTYAFGLVSLILAIGFITVVDLAHFIPKYQQTVSNDNSSQSQTPTTNTSSSSTYSSTSTSATSSSNRSNSYQPPVTSLS